MRRKVAQNIFLILERKSPVGTWQQCVRGEDIEFNLAGRGGGEGSVIIIISPSQPRISLSWVRVRGGLGSFLPL